jgi:ribonucleoside-triphosphate reductase
LDLISLRPEPSWGPTGKEVYERTYSRTKPDGSKETWDETVRRVVKGNLSLVDSARIEPGEEQELYEAIYNFRIIPAGRHLWMSGVEGRQFLFNCYVSGWGDRLSEHFAFTFNQLMEGGGVGANYSTRYVSPERYPVRNLVNVKLYCDPSHPDYDDLVEEGLLTNDAHDAWKVPDSREGWVRALGKVINATIRPSKSIEFTIRIDLSNIRAAGLPIKTFGGTSAGPVPLAKLLKSAERILGSAWELGGMPGWLAMELDHEIANCVVSGNVRRSARMSIMHWNDPNIDWFLKCKESGKEHWSTNISVEIDDEFIQLLGYDPVWNDIEHETNVLSNKAKRVYRAIIEGMLTNGEPGIWNSSLANTGEPNYVSATNPCGEICLEEFENCNLGHVNLDSFVNPDGSVDFKGLHRAHVLMTRFLIRATFGDISNDKTRKIVDRNRRIGVGHFGFAGYLAKRGIPFSDSYHEAILDRRMNQVCIWGELQDMYEAVHNAAYAYSHELRIPMPVKLTTVAPTGTIAKLAGRTEGIHPPYAKYFIRRVRYSTIDPDQNRKVKEFRLLGYDVEADLYTPNTVVVSFPTKESLVAELEELGISEDILESVDEISLEDMLNVQKMYQTYYADNAVSFTVNVPNGKYSVSEVAEILLPFLPYLKGTTMMVDESREQAPYERISKEEFEYVAYGPNGSYEVNDSYDESCASGACPVR